MTVYPGLVRRLNQTASTQRRKKVGKKFDFEASLASVSCSSPYPADPEIRNRLGLETPNELLEVYTLAVDIVAGDVFTYSGIDYPVKSAAHWPMTGGRFLKLILEDLKT